MCLKDLVKGAPVDSSLMKLKNWEKQNHQQSSNIHENMYLNEVIEVCQNRSDRITSVSANPKGMK